MMPTFRFGFGAGAGAALVLCAAALPAQQTMHRAPAAAVLAQTTNEGLVTLSLRDVTLKTALVEISQQSGVMLAYSERVVPLAKRVSISVTRVPVIDALRQVLAGTDVLVRPTAAGKIALVKDAAGEQDADGIVRGTVTDAATKRPLLGARVSIPALKTSVPAGAAGTFTLSIPAGTYTIQVQLLGYAPQTRKVTLKARDSVRADFALTAVASRLQEVITTGAGQRKKFEVGNSVGTINADSVMQNTPIRNLSDLLNGRVAGTQVSSTSGAVGSGSSIRIRGVSSVTASSDPIIIIDGIRADAGFSQAISGSTAGGNTSMIPAFFDQRSAGVNQQTGNPSSSRLNDIDPESIETIEVLKGPSAATLYGSDAANGVIVITTKRGHAGPTRWSVFGQRGVSTMHASFMDAWYGWGTYPTQPGRTDCPIATAALGLCTIDSVTHYNPLNHHDTSPLGTGSSTRLGMQVSGGSAQVQYFLGGTYNDEQGLEKLSPFDTRAFLDARGGTPLPDWVKTPNTFNTFNLNSKLTAQLASVADVALSTAYIREYHRDDLANSFILASTSSLGYFDPATGGWGTTYSPRDSYLTRSNESVNRGTAGLTGNWRPTSFLSGHVTAGGDYTSRVDDALQPTNILPGITGQRGKSDGSTLVRTLDAGGTLDLPLNVQFRSRTSVGGQYTRTDQDGVSARGYNLPNGSDVLNDAEQRYVSEFHSASAVAGWYIDETLSLNDRLFVTGAVRGDASSSFGRNAQTVLYPKLNASWLVSQEPMFPKLPGLSSLRLRAALGHAGVQPAVDARFRSFKGSDSYFNGTSYPGIIVSTIGNTQLLPERSTESEGGFDLGLWDERLSLEATMYRKVTRDALISRPLPPSAGLTSRQENIGKVENRGLELSLTARPIVTEPVNWTMVVNVSQNRNRLVTLGPTALPASTQFNATEENRYVAGYPLNGYWDRPILAYSDVNHDGLIDTTEIRLSDSLVYRGQPFPKATVSMRNDVSLFSGWMSIGLGLDYTGGLTQRNDALYQQCSLMRCQFAVDPSIDLRTQAFAAAGLSDHTVVADASTWMFLEHTSYLRLSELSFTFTAPARLTRALRARSASISLMGRNLALWSSYRGADPDVNTIISGNQLSDQGGVPQPRDWSIRVNLGF